MWLVKLAGWVRRKVREEPPRPLTLGSAGELLQQGGSNLDRKQKPLCSGNAALGTR